MVKNKISETVFAYSTSAITNPKSKNTSLNLEGLFEKISNFKPVDYEKIGEITIKGLSSGEDIKVIKKAISPFKMGLPFALFSGFQPTGHDNKNLQYNGCIQIDIDIKEKGGDSKAVEVKKALSQLPYIALAAISPSQVGVKALVFTDNFDINSHLIASAVVIEQVAKDIALDQKYFDNLGASQPVFLPYDKECYINRNYTVFATKEKIEAALSTPQHRAKKSKNVDINRNVDVRKSILEGDDKKMALDLSWGYATKTKGETFATPFVQSFVGCAIKFGVSAADSVAYLLGKVGAEDFCAKRQNSLHDMYSRYAYNFGTATLEHEIENVEFDGGEKEYKIDRKLSELVLDLSKNSFIKAPTGSGKSFYVAKIVKEKRVMVVPTQSLVLQFAKEYNATPFFQDAKNVENDDFIVTTYSSLSNLIDKIDPKKYVLFVDEAHNFTAAASKMFLLEEMTEVLDSLHLFKNFHLLSATPLFNVEKKIANLRLIDISFKKSVVEKRFVKVVADDTLNAIKDIALVCKEKNTQFVVLSNNTNEAGRLGKLKNVLSSLNIAVINSKTKNSDEYFDVAIEGDMKNCDGIIATTVIKEGNSITQHTDNVAVIVDGQFHPAELEQISARFRNAKKVEMFLLKHASSQNQYIPFSINMELEKIYKTIATMGELRTAMENSSTPYNEMALLSQLEQLYFKKIEDAIVEDGLAISNKIFEQEKRVANADMRYIVSYLSQKFGWKHDPETDTIHSKSTLSAEEKKDLNAAMKIAKNANEEKEEKILSQIIEDGFEKNAAILEKLKKSSESDAKEVELRSVSNFIYRHYDTENVGDVVAILSGYNTKQAKSLIYKNTTIRKIKETPNFDEKNPVQKFVRDVSTAFSLGEFYSNAEINTIFVECLTKTGLFDPEKHGSKNKITTFLKSFFLLEKGKKRNGDNTINGYTVISTDLLPFELRTFATEDVQHVPLASLLTAE